MFNTHKIVYLTVQDIYQGGNLKYDLQFFKTFFYVRANSIIFQRGVTDNNSRLPTKTGLISWRGSA